MQSIGPRAILWDMSVAIKQTVTVRPGGIVEVRSPELRAGDQAEVTVVVTQAAGSRTGAGSAVGWRRYAGAVNSGDALAGNNQRIDADLATEHRSGSKADS